MSGIKTGNKGFVNPLDGKVYTVDPVAKGEDGVNVSPNLAGYDPGDMTVDNTVKDLGKKTKLTLGSYLSKSTLGQAGSSIVSNAYPIDPPKDSSQESSLLTEKGYPSPLTPATLGNSKKFAADLPSSISDNYAKGTVTAGDVTTLLSKGKSEESATKKLLDGNEILPGIKKIANAVTLPGALIAYTGAAIKTNYRVPGVTNTQFAPSEINILSPAKNFDPALLNYNNLIKVGPGSEAVVSGSLSLTLKDTYGYAALLTTGSKNVYPVVSPQNFNLANLFSFTDIDGYPVGITPPTSINAARFTDSPGSSVSDDYKLAVKEILDNGKLKETQVISKGKTLPAEKKTLFDGHRLLQSITKIEGVVTLPGPLNSYYTAAIDPNYRNPNDGFTIDNILSPPEDFDPKLLIYNNLLKVDPADEAVVQNDLNLKLADVLKTPQRLTIDSKNDYPVIVKDNNITSITTNGFPSPLTPPENQNEYIFTKVPGSSVSSDYAKAKEILISLGGPVTQLISKGKSKEKAGEQLLNGNELFQNIIKNKNDVVTLPAALKSYYKAAIEPNTFNFSVPFTSKEQDILQPTTDLMPGGLLVNDVNVFGKYYGLEGDNVLKTQITLGTGLLKAQDETSINKYQVSFPTFTSDQLLESEGLDAVLRPITTKDTKVPSPLINGNAQNSYVSRDDIKPSSTDPNLTNSGFSKGKNVGSPYDGHNLLRKIDGNVNVSDARYVPPHGSGASYQKNADIYGNSAIDEFGKKTDTPAVPDKHPLNDYIVDHRLKSTVLGLGNNRFAPRGQASATFNPTLKMVATDGTLKEISHMSMARVGIGLAQRASAEIPAWTSTPTDKFNPIGNAAELGAIVPSVAQLGILKVNDRLLEARDVLDSLTEGEEEEYDTGALVSIAPFDGQSWGTLNSPSEPFDGGFSSVGLAVLMVLLVAAISGIFAGIAEFKTKNPTKAKSSSVGQRVKGKYLFEESPANAFTSFLPNAFEIFGLRETNNDFRLCLGAGATAFFLGTDSPEANFLTTIQGAAGILVDSLISDESKVGANIVVCRTIIRSGVLFAQYVDSVMKAGRNSAYAAARSTLSIVLKVIRSSKIISAMNVFASLGDTLIDRQNAIKKLRAEYTDENNKKQYSIGFDAIDPAAPRAAIQKNRLTFKGAYDSTLAWSAQRSPAMYLINKDLDDLSLAKIGGQFSGPSGLEKKTKGGTDNSDNVQTNSSVNGRIGDAARLEFENKLDSEYVPFYFHDVRTNEIISFHAFLASLSDDYTASYESTEGFGRVEPVKIYKGTTRKISMSFYVAALDEKDFDHMWAKINKLTTLVYPQYTQGRILTAGTNQFIAPFSQLPGASPLIRIRLGDLLRSNYSKFALARLFGAGSKRNSLGGMKIPMEDDPDKSVEVIGDFAIGSSAREQRQVYIYKGNYDKNSKIKLEPFVTYLKTHAVKELNRNTLPESITVVNDKITTTSTIQVENPTIVNGTAKDGYTIKVSISKAVVDPNTNEPGTTEVTIENVPVSAVDPTDEALDTKFPLSNRVASADLLSFLNPQKNAIVRSFESAGGKGLAGVIESINFDWYDRVTWETISSDDRGQAPKMCKVTLSFTPIHDITPGIDHMGYNRAPIYPVGRAMKSSS